MRCTRLCLALLAALSVALWVTDASAATCTGGGLTATYGGTNAGTAAGAGVPPVNLSVSTNCAVFGGNDLGANGVVVDNPFGTIWQLADASNSTVAGDQTIKLNDYGSVGATSGNWFVTDLIANSDNGYNGFTNIMITLSKGTDYVAFLLDEGVTSGFWSTVGLFLNPGNGNPQNLSHLSVWYDPTLREDVPSPVPLPPAVLLFISGLAALKFLSGRRRNMEA